MAVIRQMTGEVDVTAPGSSRRPPVSLESGLDMTRRQYPAPALSPVQIKIKGACAGDEKPALI